MCWFYKLCFVLFFMEGANPFRMIGSYIGVVFGLVGAYLSFMILFYLAEIGRFNLLAFLIPMVPIVVGFLFGWWVQVLIEGR